MLGRLSLVAVIPILLLASPALAVTAKEKQETCKIGADSQQLTGAKRTIFINRCMAKGNYEPPGRKVAKKPAAKKPMKPAAAPAQATPAPAAPANPPPKQ